MTNAPKPSIAAQPFALYNMWPRNYSNSLGSKTAFEAMRKDLPRIAELGFNAVYVNPFYEVGAFPKADQGLTGSLYASSNMLKSNPVLFGGKNMIFSLDGQLTDTGREVKFFCDAARKNNIVPMFDLVQSHLSPDSPYIAEAKKQGLTIMKRHNNGNFDIHNLDENYQPKASNPRDIWDDVIKFNYDDPKAKAFITQKILIPYVEQMAEIGFRGIRIDSTPETPADVHQAVVSAFKQRIRELDGKRYVEPPILAETLNNPVSPRAAEVNGVATHCYSSGYFFPGEDEKNRLNLVGSSTYNHGRHWLKAEMWDKQHGMNGGAIIPISTHDEKRLRTQLEELFAHDLLRFGPNNREKSIKHWARIKLAFAAFFSSGGYMMTSGEEFLLSERPSVFDGRIVSDYHPLEPGGRKILTAEQQEEIIAQAKKSDITKPLAYEIDGKTYYFLVRQGYRHPVWKQQEGTTPKKEEVLVQLNPHKKIPNLLQEQKKQASVKRGEAEFSDFVRQINQAVKQRKPISPEFYSDVYFAYRDTQIMGIVSYVTQGENKGAPYEVTLIDVSGKKRQANISDGVLEDIAKQAHISVNYLKEHATIIGDFPENRDISKRSASL